MMIASYFCFSKHCRSLRNVVCFFLFFLPVKTSATLGSLPWLVNAQIIVFVIKCISGL